MNMFSYRDKFQNRSRGALPWLRSDIFKCNVHDQKNCAIQATLGFICKPLHKSMYMVLNVIERRLEGNTMIHFCD